jgi:hypothetical protein
MHPRWRQGQNRQYYNKEQIMKYHTNSDSMTNNMFQVTLKRGDLLYLPSFYIHAVSSGCGSVSMNLWVQSSGLTVVDTLKKQGVVPTVIPLPPTQQTVLSENMVILAYFIHQILLMHVHDAKLIDQTATYEHIVSTFLVDLTLRYSQVIQNDVTTNSNIATCETTTVSDICTENTNNKNGNNNITVDSYPSNMKIICHAQYNGAISHIYPTAILSENMSLHSLCQTNTMDKLNTSDTFITGTRA